MPISAAIVFSWDSFMKGIEKRSLLHMKQTVNKRALIARWQDIKTIILKPQAKIARCPEGTALRTPFYF
jgi:hypothetical protein